MTDTKRSLHLPDSGKPYELLLQRHLDARGLLSSLDLPFSINRIYTITKNLDNSERGHHAHKQLRQIIFCFNGSFRLTLSTPTNSQTFMMEENGPALFIPAGYWRVMDDFSEGATVLVLASDKYDERDYIRDYNEYIEWFRQGLK